MGKQAKTQTSYWDKQKPFTNAHVHKQCTVIEKKNKLLRQMHTYIVWSQKSITNAHTHKQCAVKKHTDKLLRQTKANYKCSHK